MILILSHAEVEATTEDVIDWLSSLGASFLRINGDDIDGAGAVHISTGNREEKSRLIIGGRELQASKVKAVWFRRWMRDRQHENTDLLAVPSEKLAYDIKRHLTLESRRISRFLFSRFSNVPWLSEPETSTINKLEALELAATAGLTTPATLVTTERHAVQEFAARCERLITKPIGEVAIFVHQGLVHFMYTAVLDRCDIEALPERFALSLFQEKIEKTFEVRVFYLDGECYPMAIFSQLDPQTQADFRRYNTERPNRTVPYRLSSATIEGIRQLMSSLDLDTGSIDLIRTPEKQHVFLEVNPVGQFGMVSYPCNYPLERKVAEALIQRACHEN